MNIVFGECAGRFAPLWRPKVAINGKLGLRDKKHNFICLQA
jgi:hypothetical protein